MSLTLDDMDLADGGFVGDWFLPPRAFFMTSPAYTVLMREMRRYVDGEILGRSVLIAAHRGGGKTSLADRVTKDLQREALRAAVGPSLLRKPQRPLVVKLHGGALFTPPSEGAKPSAETALQQLTTALYRALVNEVSDAYALHARAVTRPGAPPGEFLERAAQLTLDLDLTPDLAALRASWEQLRRLREGVLWPGPTGQRMVEQGWGDRGMREIVALATTNHAFRKCAGRIEAKLEASDAAERSAQMKRDAKLDFKDLVNKLWGLAAGVLTGAALWDPGSRITAAVAGASAALLGTLVLGWSTERSQRNARRSDYTFLPDNSLQTLDRDLPVIIQRIREAGLAPIFVIDELDKLKNPAACIETLIDRLKNLVTDSGFFCFLTDRYYFDEIEAKTRATAYPREHSFFSERLLLAYGPADMAYYVNELWRPAPPVTLKSTAAWVLTEYTLHAARLNIIDLQREAVRLGSELETSLSDMPQILGSSRFLVAVAVQLAIEHVLRDGEIRERVRDDPAFAQLAIEMLYRISRAWAAGDEVVELTETTLRRNLLRRRGSREDAVTAEMALSNAATEADLGTLTAKVLRLAMLLMDFKAIEEAIRAEGGVPSVFEPPPYGSPAESEAAKLAALLPLLLSIPGVPNGLLDRVDGLTDTFRFRFDRFGVPLVDWPRDFAAVGLAITEFDGLVQALGGLE